MLTKRQITYLGVAGSLASLVGLALYFIPPSSATAPMAPVTASGNGIAIGRIDHSSSVSFGAAASQAAATPSK